MQDGPHKQVCASPTELAQLACYWGSMRTRSLIQRRAAPPPAQTPFSDADFLRVREDVLCREVSGREEGVT